MLRWIALLTLLAAPVAAYGQTQCAPREIVVERLASDYGESFQGGGLNSETTIFEVWSSDESGTWTIVRTFANGTSCVMAAGTNWRAPLPSDKANKDDKS